MGIAREVKPQGVARRNNATLVGQNVTYDETGVTYDDANYFWGGLSDDAQLDSVFGHIRNIGDVKPTIKNIASNI